MPLDLPALPPFRSVEAVDSSYGGATASVNSLAGHSAFTGDANVQVIGPRLGLPLTLVPRECLGVAPFLPTGSRGSCAPVHLPSPTFGLNVIESEEGDDIPVAFPPMFEAATNAQRLAPPPESTEAPLSASQGHQSVPAQKINPTNRTLRFIVPVSDGPAYLGDVELAVAPDDTLSVVAPRLEQLLQPLLKKDVYDSLVRRIGSSVEVSAATLQEAGISIHYDSARLALSIELPVEARELNRLSLRDVFSNGGETLEPANFSGYLNLRGALDLIEEGSGDRTPRPSFGLDGAIRMGPVVAEAEAFASTRKGDPGFRRIGSRLVYDDLANTVRYALGDVRAIPTTFQSAPSTAGLSVSRLYNVLEPQRETRSNGSQGFSIYSASTVETVVNGRVVERRTLQPGNYNLQDFPLADGSNQVELRIEDATGQRRIVNFDLYYSRTLLTPGLTEFSVFAGVYSAPTRRGIDYSNDWTASAFVRKGLTDQITAGINAQADAHVQQGGVELLVGTSLGLFGADLSASRKEGGGTGFATAMDFERTITGNGDDGQSVHAVAEYRSADFAVPGTFLSVEPIKWRLLAGYTRNLGRDRFITADMQYSRDRVRREDRLSARATFGFRLTNDLAGQFELRYDKGTIDNGFVARIGIVKRFGLRAAGRAEVDSRGTARASFQASGGDGIGAWSGDFDAARSDSGANLNANVFYQGNRFDGGVNQIVDYDNVLGRTTSARTSVRISTALAFADGIFAIGRPVTDSFMVARTHSSLGGKPVRVDPRNESEMARSGAFGPALIGNLSAYSQRTMLYDVENVPAGYDLGTGNVQLLPKYRAGYALTVGSDYHLLVVGKLVSRDGKAISLLTGTAIELAKPDRPAVTVFTGRDGRFAAQGLRAGRWRITMASEPPTTFEFEVADDPSGTIRVGTLEEVDGEQRR